MGLRAKFPEIQVRLYCDCNDREKGNEILASASQWVIDHVGPSVFTTQDQSMAEVVGGLLAEQEVTVAVAESCTGGLISNWLTNTAGSSDYFLMGAVTYSNAAKVNILDVSPETLNRLGAVNEAIALEMAQVLRAEGQEIDLPSL